MNIISWSVSFSLVMGLCSAPNSRKRGYVDGDIIIGALFPIHEQPTVEGTYTRECGRIRETYGMHRVEVLLKTIKEINNNPEILPGITLGVDIRDTCWYVPIALEQSIDFIKNSLSHQEIIQTLSRSRNASVKEIIESQAGSGKAIASLIGPGGSTVTVQVQNLLQLFKIPQISYSATSIDLSKKELYKFFLRVVPSDILQTRALIDLIVYFKWEYVSLVNTQGQYGSQGIKELKNIMKDKDICTDVVIEIENNEQMTQVIEKARKLFDKDRAKVIICFCQGETVKQLFQAMIKLNKTNKGYLIIGTDGWADRNDILGMLLDKENGARELSGAALGGLSMRLHSMPIEGFDEYFRSKNSSDSPGNPWFREFWEQTFKCRISSHSYGGVRKCFGNESLFDVDYVQDSKLGFVVKSVMTVAHGLHNLHKKLCSKADNKCLKFFHLNGTALLEEILNVTFKAYDNETVYFDNKGDPPGRYDIMNYQYQREQVSGKMTYKYQRVGTWKDNMLVVDGTIQWPGVSPKVPVQSYCSPPCGIGQIREISGTKKCCWQCKPCGINEYIRINTSEEMCIECQRGTVPNNNKTKCIRINPSYIHWSYGSSIIAVIFSCIGISVSIVVTAILAKYNNTPVVKSSTRELMYAILVGIVMCFLTTFPLLARPTIFSCTLTRFMPGLSFSLIFGALVTKTNRICRILATSKKKIIRNKGRFLTTKAQIVITGLLNLVEIVIIIAMVVLEPPSPIETFPAWNKTQLICNNSDKSVFIPFGFDAFLVCLCTWYAVKTRNLPENFNEAKYIGFTMYTTCIIWIGLIPIYFGAEFRVISMCFAINLSASTALILLFFPKVYIILFKPEKNERSAFTTTTEIRCHIGPGFTNHQCSKEKTQRMELNRPMIRNDSQSSQFTGNLTSYSCHHYMPTITSTTEARTTSFDKSVQTEAILILNCLSQNGDNEGAIVPDDISVTQIALLQFLDENWEKNSIPITDMMMVPQSRSTDLDQVIHGDQHGDHDNDNDDEKSLMNPGLPAQIVSDRTYSPMSTVSTDASSTISTLFLEYLKVHGRRFSKNKDNKAIKL